MIETESRPQNKRRMLLRDFYPLDEIPKLVKGLRKNVSIDGKLFSQSDLARAFDTSQAAISQAENDTSGRMLGLQKRIVAFYGYTLIEGCRLVKREE